MNRDSSVTANVKKRSRLLPLSAAAEAQCCLCCFRFVLRDLRGARQSIMPPRSAAPVRAHLITSILRSGCMIQYLRWLRLDSHDSLQRMIVKQRQDAGRRARPPRHTSSHPILAKEPPPEHESKGAWWKAQSSRVHVLSQLFSHQSLGWCNASEYDQGR